MLLLQEIFVSKFSGSRAAYRVFKNSRQDLLHCPRETPEMSEDSQPETSGRNQAGQFIKGYSGNLAGRPSGIRNKSAQLIETLMAGDAEAISVRVIDAAKNGDMTAARLILDRLLPASKDNPINIPLGAIKTTKDVAAAMSSILDSVGTGELTPGQGEQVTKLLEGYLRMLQSTELEKRLTALEARLADTI